ncbi:4'-phosphopantetheinyl transferase [Dichomitus squalens LYAD-421 SS1]|uniref:4'-phosphopantetheinyl transferase n=1 Tax=Dichomitus squalens (strain LYAD-421) TaxID=732165 RepID=UPI0004414A99|nr:4'-phosphopantetheinyl transferase [Dichomitus squalens LYAD-421 SS1]EJF62931.1 4'-phosphopantetheinyl transferase [Dichomitus squalens LYAD-421 SS1]
MGILGIGVDILHVPRIARLIDGKTASRFARRVLSEKELLAWNAIPLADHARRARYLAVRWSIKEAAYKAVFPLRPTWKNFTYHSLSADGQRKPWLEYHSDAPGRDLGKIHASVSHDGDYVFTTVLAEAP